MNHALFNKKNEKVLTIASLSKSVMNTLFETPNFYAIFFFTKGKGTILMDKIERDIQDNYILFYYPYQQLELNGTFEGFYIRFHPDFFCIDIHAKDIGCQGLLFNNFLNDTILRCSVEEYEVLYNSFLGIKKELLTKDIGQLDMVSSQLKMFLINAVRIKRSQQQGQVQTKENLHLQLEQLIGKYYATEASPEFYTKKMDVSLTTFNRLCKKYFRNSFVSILNQKKIAVAKNQLFLTNNSIKDIAYHVGFNDPLYFTRVFKKYSSVSPKEFRKQLKENRLV
ncbi:helix-turn-helix transcriptional regulator [Flagellimonas pacifica]|uniref:AraC-type DNA-binding protein n=1 Tax=Flagellimonas pacifica TaxID=1247520 RepID=A0A285MZC5_9FLAO|nr:AraC family transcriptional regulator [Allomuricauda parva]SNZ02033.1 AraC-type DNA-binding protein [Allomuricauda parva]